MSKETNTSPATKADIAELQSLIAELQRSNERWKEQIIGSNHSLYDEVLEAFQAFKDDAIRHFDILFEQFRDDIIGSFGDRYESLREVQQKHGRRLNRLEIKFGLGD